MCERILICHVALLVNAVSECRLSTLPAVSATASAATSDSSKRAAALITAEVQTSQGATGLGKAPRFAQVNSPSASIAAVSATATAAAAAAAAAQAAVAAAAAAAITSPSDQASSARASHLPLQSESGTDNSDCLDMLQELRVTSASDAVFSYRRLSTESQFLRRVMGFCTLCALVLVLCCGVYLPCCSCFPPR